MTTSYRNQVAEAFRAALLGKTSAGQNVHTRLDRPLDPRTDLPAIMVYASRAKRGPQDYGNSVVPREIEVTIEFAVSALPEAALDAADTQIEAIEDLIEADPTLGNLVQDTRWQRSVTDTTNHGGATLGVGLLQYEVCILTNLRGPEAFAIGDDGFSGTPVVVFSVPDTTQPAILPEIVPDPRLECGPGGCAPPAWGGEVKKNGDLIV